MDGPVPVQNGNTYPSITIDGHANVIVGNVYHPGALTKEQKCHLIFKTSSFETYKDRNPRRAAGTCRWLLNHPQYCEWLSDNQNALLWVSADPGCGKSVLSKALVDEILPNDNPNTVCYFFFKDNEEQDNLTTALCAILHQLFDQRPHLLHYAIPAWEKNGEKLRNETQEMWRIFSAAAMDREAGPIICVLDALDECRDADRQQLIQLLCGLQHSTVQGRSPGILKVLATSRPYDNVQRWFSEATSRWPHIRLRGEDENDQIHQEINLVIKQRVQELSNEFRIAPDVRDSVSDQLLSMKHRTYLWLHLAVEEVRGVCRDSVFADEVQIKPLATSVQDAYERLLGKITERQKPLARSVLLIIVGARRPLSVQEMALALSALRAGEQNISTLERVDPCRLEQQIREQCGLFIFINHSQLFLIHQTAKEFLVTQSAQLTQSLTQWKSCFQERQIEHKMTTICVTYLHLRHATDFNPPSESQPTDSGRVIPDFTSQQVTGHVDDFWQYCAEYWTHHLQDEPFQQNERLLNRIISLLTTNTDLFSEWFRIYWNTIYPYGEQVENLQCQHVIAITGHTFALQDMFRRCKDDVLIDAKDSSGRTPLFWAAERGHREMVQMLLDKGTDVNAQGGEYGDDNALLAASAGGHEKVVQMLLDKGANVNAQGGYYGNALQAASAGGHEKVVQMLLDKGANVNAQGGVYGNALQAASAGGHEKVVQMLLDKGADVNAQGGRYGNALQAASAGGHEKVVQMLLDKGANVNAQGGYYGNALQAASAGGHEKVVQMLLDKGANVNAQGGVYGNALQAASAGGHEKVVQMLLDKGADVNAQGGRYGNALQAASEGGHEMVAQMLLDKGADVNAQGGRYGNALYAASACGHEKVVQMLLDKGTDVNAQGGEYGDDNALLAASAGGHEKVVQMLLDRGAAGRCW